MRSPGLVMAASLIMAGCQQGGYSGTVSLAHNQFHVVMVRAAAAERTATISVTASGGAVDVYVVLEPDEDAARRAAGTALATRKAPAGALLSKAKVEQTEVEVPIPPQKGFAVLFCNGHGKTASLTLKVTTK